MGFSLYRIAESCLPAVMPVVVPGAAAQRDEESGIRNAITKEHDNAGTIVHEFARAPSLARRGASKPLDYTCICSTNHMKHKQVHLLVDVTGAGVVVVTTVVTMVPAEVNLVVVFSVVVMPLVLVDTVVNMSGKHAKHRTSSIFMNSLLSSSTISGTIFTAVANTLLGKATSMTPFSSASYT